MEIQDRLYNLIDESIFLTFRTGNRQKYEIFVLCLKQKIGGNWVIYVNPRSSFLSALLALLSLVKISKSVKKSWCPTYNSPVFIKSVEALMPIYILFTEIKYNESCYSNLNISTDDLVKILKMVGMLFSKRYS